MTPSAAAPVLAKGRLVGTRFFLPQSLRGELRSQSPAHPADLIGVFPFGEEDVLEVVVAAARAARPFGQEPLEQRLRLLTAFRAELARAMPDLVALLQREQGRPRWECQREVQGLLGRIDQVTEGATDLLADRRLEDLPARVRSLPLGVVAVLSPAILPLATAHTHIVAALAAGNAVIWKPSPLVPASAQRYAEVVQRTGFPVGVFSILMGDDAVGYDLATQPQVDAVVFTGRTEQGQRLRNAFATRFDAKLILHLSAKNPALVLEDADLSAAAYEVVTSACMTAGQRCTALCRVYVHHAVLDEFIEQALSVLAALQIGATDSAFMGPLLSPDRLAAFSRHLRVAQAGGARALSPPRSLPSEGHFASPSLHLLPRRNPADPYQSCEVLGPDLAVYPISDLDEGIHACEDSPFGLCATLFSASPLRWRRFCEELRTGALFWNRGTTAPSGRLPFGGYKHSGLGDRAGADAVLAFRREISLLGRTSELPERLPGTQFSDSSPLLPREIST